MEGPVAGYDTFWATFFMGCISPSAVVLLSWSPIGHCGGKIMSDMYTNLNLESQHYLSESLRGALVLPETHLPPRA